MSTKEENKYRLGNQPEEYELVTKYLGWLPEGKTSWDEFLFPKDEPFPLEIKNKLVVLISPNKAESIRILCDNRIIKDAFPFEFYKEERSNNWDQFCIVARDDEPFKKFIIPLY
jgi:hypothetical protein